jgi:hypothetical protein
LTHSLSKRAQVGLGQFLRLTNSGQHRSDTPEEAIKFVVPVELLKVVRRIDQRGADETAYRAAQNFGRVFRS